MKIEYYHVNAFTAEIFRGNPAAVVPLDSQELFDSDDLLQKLAAEFNLPASAFYLALDGNSSVQIKWFSPLKRIPICGHGSLAASHVIFHSGWNGDSIDYDAGPAGHLTALRSSDGSIILDFPACNLVGLEEAGKALRLGVDLHAVLRSALPSDAQFTITGRGDRGGYVDMLVVELQEDYPLKDTKFNAQQLVSTLSIHITCFLITIFDSKSSHLRYVVSRLLPAH
jgi:predicted PhzF superfamily epimerase YddE/YHI9